MTYVSARYAPPIPLSPPDAPQQVVATDDRGQEWFLTEDSEVGDWLRYIENGGTIDPMDEVPEAKPAPELEPEPEPEPEPQPAPPLPIVQGPPPDPLPDSRSVPRAEPDVVYGEPLEE